MIAVLPLLAMLAAFVLCSMRPLREAHNARTPHQLADSIRSTAPIWWVIAPLWAFTVAAVITLASAVAVVARPVFDAACTLAELGEGLAQLGDRPAEVGAA